MEVKTQNETIDLCESDEDEGSKDDSVIFNDIETITLDDDNCSVISDQASHLSISERVISPKRKPFVSPKIIPNKKNPLKTPPPKKLNQENENEDDIQVIAVQINRKKSPKKTPRKLQNSNCGKKKFGQLSPSTVYRGISSNTLIKTGGGNNKKGRKGKKKFGARNQERTPQNSPGNSNGFKNVKKGKRNKIAQQMQLQARQILQSQEVNANKRRFRNNQRAPERILSRGVPYVNGLPKFRLEPAFPDQLAREVALMTERSESPGQILGQGSGQLGQRSIATAQGTVPSALGSDPSAQASDPLGQGLGQSGQGSTEVPALPLRIVTDPGGDNLRITCTNTNAPVVDGERKDKSEDPEERPEEPPKARTPIPEENWSAFGSNCYKSGHVQNRSKGALRPVVIDGSNVAWGHGNNERFSCRGIKVCSEYFQARGHSVVAFVPRYRQKASQSDDTRILEELSKAGVVKFTPSREVDGVHICSYDDRFVVQYAADTGGIIVSNDNYKDLYDEQPLWRDTIRERILQYTWVDRNYLMFPPDPLGPRGPPLDQFLRF